MIDTKLIKAILKGALTFVPGMVALIKKKKSNHSCSNALFCYNLWLRVLVHLKETGVNTSLERIGEIGNGGSFGVGICALLSGTKEYYALEIEDIYDVEQNLNLLNEILAFFKQNTEITENPKINIETICFKYPEDLIKPLYLDEKIVKEIREDILSGFRESKRIHLVKNWQTHNSLELDFIFSRAVMEHVQNPSTVYESAIKQLKSKSFMLHDIQFHSHGLTKELDGQYKVSQILWKIIFGKRIYFLNRWQLTDHLEELNLLKCIILNVYKKYEISHNRRKVLVGASVLIKKEV